MGWTIKVQLFAIVVEYIDMVIINLIDGLEKILTPFCGVGQHLQIIAYTLNIHSNSHWPEYWLAIKLCSFLAVQGFSRILLALLMHLL